jgi:hypothetical protein
MIGKPFGDDSSTMTHRVRLTDAADVNPELNSLAARQADLGSKRRPAN